MLYSIGLKNRIRRLQMELDTFNSGLLHRLQRGAKVEPGAHTASLVRRRQGRRYSEEIDIR